MPNYFTSKTQDAIVRFNACEDYKEKNKIFEKEINYAFNKLVESLIFSLKLKSRLQDYETLKYNTIGDLVLKIHLFDGTRKSKDGKLAKAYSFFNTVAKNFILMELKKEKRSESFQDLDNDTERDKNSIDSQLILEKFATYDDVNERNEFRKIIMDFLQAEQNKCNLSIDEKILDAIEFAFKNCYETGIRNKKSLFLYLREFTGLTTTEISDFLNRFRGKLKAKVKAYNNGEI